MSDTIVSPVASTIAAAKTERAGALVGYLPVGFPSLDASIDAAVALVENGVDVLELGLPYSDPVMDGPVIQAATVAALEAGVRLRDAFTAVERIRSRVDAPVLVMTYWNPVLQYGVDRFADDLVSAGGAGLITPDLTVDSGADWLATSDRTGLDRVFLAAPTSTDERLRLAVDSSRGFVYTVSTMGITGARADLGTAARALVARLREQGADSLAVGIGVSTADQIAEILSYADGAIVGSALVKALADGGVPAVARLASELAEGTRR
ncbi:tryptophan synthase subunit alpha [Herbiconiux sp. VKM Ac-1786]|uniref:tryptophan synthase subunit alpha n=1 Tax=Herbiconiux sp. VKM Ac-1786 TaxID=2783824 RepID=UPI00188D48C6|nr:tryptophan synthase subunit alpha [Herbiconiux sp. VKM Ac-1786]MBF4573603.1 tryptophan synthase subunit alpha [Herbiconiux sp. VKM Ac-1786]